MLPRESGSRSVLYGTDDRRQYGTACEIKCGRRFAGANAAEGTCNEIDQNLFHIDLLVNGDGSTRSRGGGIAIT
jgi:hypothetical protein